MWTKDGEKETYPPAGICLQVFAHRSKYSWEEKPAGKYLQVLAPQTHSGTTSATTSTWYILASIPVGLYLSVFTCGEKAYIAKQKEEIWIGSPPRRLTRYGLKRKDKRTPRARIETRKVADY
jgi:hypothetical protein